MRAPLRRAAKWLNRMPSKNTHGRPSAGSPLMESLFAHVSATLSVSMGLHRPPWETVGEPAAADDRDRVALHDRMSEDRRSLAA